MSRSLYSVTIIDKDENILSDVKVIGENTEEAVIAVDVKARITGTGAAIKDLSIIIVEMGTIKDRTRKVKIVDEDDA